MAELQPLGWLVIEHTHAGPFPHGDIHETRDTAVRESDRANESATAAGVPMNYTVAALIEEDPATTVEDGEDVCPNCGELSDDLWTVPGEEVQRCRSCATERLGRDPEEDQEAQR